METIAVSELRANFKEILKTIGQGNEISITSRGKVIARIVPPEDSIDNARNKLKEIGKNAIINDIITPVETSWNALKE